VTRFCQVHVERNPPLAELNIGTDTGRRRRSILRCASTSHNFSRPVQQVTRSFNGTIGYTPPEIKYVRATGESYPHVRAGPYAGLTGIWGQRLGINGGQTEGPMRRFAILMALSAPGAKGELGAPPVFGITRPDRVLAAITTQTCRL